MEFTVDARRLDGRLIRWFAPPTLATSEDTRRAHALWLASWPFFGVVTGTLAFAVAVDPETLSRRAITIAAVGVLVALIHEMSRRGRPVLASWMLVIGLTVIVTQRAWNTGGIHAPVAVFYTLFVIMAGALLGARAGTVTAAVCLTGAIFLTMAEQLGWLTAPNDGRRPVSLLIFVVLTIGLTLVLQKLLTARPPRGTRLSDDLVQMFVHDMRQPITTLLGQLSLLREDASGRMAISVDEAIGGARTLNRMANNLLDISRLEARRMPVAYVPTDVVAVARNVVSSMAALAAGRDIAVNARLAVTCRCDAELLRRILENLVSNAIKHTPAGTKILVHVESAPGCVRVAVEDSGPGILAEHRTRIFEKFSAGATQTESGYHSTGLGLAFCKLAVEAHGGTIRVQDAAPKGSVFIVELPA